MYICIFEIRPEIKKLSGLGLHFTAPPVEMIAYIVAAIMLVTNIGGGEGGIGINWGRNNAQRLIPSTVVDLLLQIGIKEARIYSSQADILKAFSGSGIDLTITIFYYHSISTEDDARQWVNERIPYIDHATIRRIYIGLDAFARGLSNKTELNAAITAYTLMQNTLNETKYRDIVKVTMPHPDIILNVDNVTRPSDADFRDEIKEEMHTFLQLLKANKAPLIIELFPIHYVFFKNLGNSFAFPDDRSEHVIKDINGAVYTNAFTLLYDSFVWAIKKAGVPDLDIVVGAVGWPTDGFPGANASSAEQFYKHLLPYVMSSKGTPMRPGKPIDTYIHALTDENKNSDYFAFARHWGIYRTNGEPKYKIDLSGQGRDVYPARAKGIQRMPKRWCVYKEDVKNDDNSVVVDQLELACKNSDCTSLALGGACSGLSFEQNVSYAFNMCFQMKFQDESWCRFDGYGMVVTENPSTGTCVFPVEVVRGQQDNYNTGQGPCSHRPGFAQTFVFLLSIFWVLLYRGSLI